MKIPEALYGDRKEVRTRWRAVTRGAIRARSWDVALGEEPLVSLDDTDGTLVLEGPFPAPDRHVFLFQVMTQLGELTVLGDGRRDESNSLRIRLIVDGLERPWFRLALLGASPLWLSGSPPESEPLADLALSSLLSTWPTFVALDDRFAMADGSRYPWPYWAARPFCLCSVMGVPERELRPVRIAAHEGCLDPWEAAEAMHDWLKRWRLQNPGRELVR